jgi:hypothetical protein
MTTAPWVSAVSSHVKAIAARRATPRFLGFPHPATPEGQHEIRTATELAVGALQSTVATHHAATSARSSSQTLRSTESTPVCSFVSLENHRLDVCGGDQFAQKPARDGLTLVRLRRLSSCPGQPRPHIRREQNSLDRGVECG